MNDIVVIREFLGPDRWGRFIVWEGDDERKALDVARRMQAKHAIVPVQHLVCRPDGKTIVVGGTPSGVTETTL